MRESPSSPSKAADALRLIESGELALAASALMPEIEPYLGKNLPAHLEFALAALVSAELWRQIGSGDPSV